MEQSKAMEHESRKASSDILKPRDTYILNALVSHVREPDINAAITRNGTSNYNSCPATQPQKRNAEAVQISINTMHLVAYNAVVIPQSNTKCYQYVYSFFIKKRVLTSSPHPTTRLVTSSVRDFCPK
jgi:hypothetical protein